LSAFRSVSSSGSGAGGASFSSISTSITSRAALTCGGTSLTRLQHYPLWAAEMTVHLNVLR
jgi:hypothetical protein